ncbi:MAG TPA: hypothetical protein VN176_09855 [Verrucomicrobiae bacterium]|nr:hypothetical protein [Verrucomicrobiae bacterium]
MRSTSLFLLALAMALSVRAQTTQGEGNAAAAAASVALQSVAPQAVALPFNQGNPDVKVWVNTDSGVYHCPGTRWYGVTRHGVYMTQAEAQKKGYRPAYGTVCR